MYKVIINEISHNIEVRGNEICVDNELLDWDLLSINNSLFHLITNSESYLIEIISIDSSKKHLKLKVNGCFFEIVVQDKYDILLEKLGMQPSDSNEHHEIRAPMPGMILDILVKEGQQVSKGQKLFVLEAMKMENIIKSNREGAIESIHIKKGMNVEKNQILIQF